MADKVLVSIKLPNLAGARTVTSVAVTSTTVGGALKELRNLGENYEAMFDRHGNLLPYLRCILNESDVRSLQGVDTALQEGDAIILLAALAGG